MAANARACNVVAVQTVLLLFLPSSTIIQKLLHSLNTANKANKIKKKFENCMNNMAFFLRQSHISSIKTHRAWQRKLRSTINNDENRTMIYACLCLLISEGDVEKFLTNESTFLAYWSDKEEQFTKYYKEEYKD